MEVEVEEAKSRGIGSRALLSASHALLFIYLAIPGLEFVSIYDEVIFMQIAQCCGNLLLVPRCCFPSPFLLISSGTVFFYFPLCYTGRRTLLVYIGKITDGFP